MAPHMHTHYMGLAGSALRTVIGLTAGLCFIAYGYGQGDIGGLMIMESFGEHFPSFNTWAHPGVLHYATLAGVVVATWNIGCVVGAAIVMFFGDRLGRKGAIAVGLAIETVGKIIQASNFSVGQYIAGRVIAGVGNGFITATIPAWQAECLKTHRRGRLLMVTFGSFITLGVTLSYWFVYAFSFAQPSSASWRCPIIFSTIFILPALAIVCFMPESPRWLLLQGRENEAISVLSALNELPPDSEDIRREILQIKNAVKHMASTPASQVFTNGEYRYLQRTMLTVLLQVMQQFTGVNIFIQYLGPMFQNQLGFENRLSMLLAACCSLEFFLASFFTVFVIDKFWGRRDLTIFGSSGMCLCMTLLCVFNYLGLHHNDAWSFNVMAAFLFLYLTFFSLGWQGMSWLWAVELVPLNIRGPANALATGANWLANFVVVLVTPILFTKLTYRTYIIFAATNFVIVPTIYFLFPETGGRSLEEVDVIFRVARQRGNPWLTAVRVAKDQERWFDKNGEPTDSYGSGSGSDIGEAEKGAFSSADEHESPDALFRERQRYSSERDSWESRGPAPAPAVYRTSDSRPSTRDVR